jgi:DNA polymerase
MGTGASDSWLMFVGEAPGKEEDKTGTPFVGSSGRWLDKFFKYLHINRSDIYITYTVKCQPKFPDKDKGRKPTYQEIMECGLWLDKEIERIKPKLIVTLGSVPLERVTGLKHVTYHHGRAIKIEKYKCYVFPLFNPGTLLHNPKEVLPKFQEDLKKLREFIKWLKK